MDEDAGDRRRAPGLVRLGAIAGIPVYVRASWFLIAGVIAVLMAPRIEAVSPGLGNLVYVAGLAFAVLLYLSVLLHEASHALAARAYGMRVRSVVLHFLGGYTELEEEANTAGREAVVAVVGPLTSLAVGALAWVVAPAAPDGLAEFMVRALAGANLVIGVVNLLPGLPLDGGRVLRAAVWGATGRPLTGSLVAGWAGRGLAVVTLAYPFVVAAALDTEPATTDVIFAAVLAAFLWVGASQAISAAKHRDRFSNLHARRLARRALAVAYDTPLGEAVRQAHEEQAGGLVVVTTDGRPVGVVNEQAVLATPADRRPWVQTGTLARTVEPGLLLAADLEGEALFRAMKQMPASEYVLVEPDGSVHGLLVTNDVAEAFSAR
ncbi:MAG: site-2 protease family protein [Actinomycetota bacterium]|nr:site-2 protease family protein [Actinomycetota bacterium]